MNSFKLPLLRYLQMLTFLKLSTFLKNARYSYLWPPAAANSQAACVPGRDILTVSQAGSSPLSHPSHWRVSRVPGYTQLFLTQRERDLEPPCWVPVLLSSLSPVKKEPDETPRASGCSYVNPKPSLNQRSYSAVKCGDNKALKLTFMSLDWVLPKHSSVAL